MKIVVLTNDNFFSFTVLKDFLKFRKDDIKLVIFSSALIGKRGTFESIKWSLKNTGLRHTTFKLSVYGVFKMAKLICKIFPFIRNKYSSFLWVKSNGLEFIDAPNVNAKKVVEKIRNIQPHLIVSVSMNQIVKKEILQIPEKGSINVHCAPLPRYCGMSPYVWALANNEDHSAATIHYMEEGLDEGDIIVQEKISVQKKDSAFALFYRCCLKASELLPHVVDEIDNDTVSSYKQNLSDKTYFSWPTKESVKSLKNNGYTLAKVKDFLLAIFKQKPRLKS